ncbi:MULTISPECIES: AMP-binding protein [Nocardioides]|uniref:AMP-binding protein n=1 Tax=Nocardioides vastitatis TaxID=2568655 RepID=A0ABW0ZN41_9ACTN|nr:AMP-binding protein [Nocardioides sp.]THJ16056.1 long-chain fatty acid--CoA ligase [Nocardioides sp.]
MLNVAQILSGATARERIALRFGELAMPVEALDNLVKQAARLFAGEGVGPGHRVAMVMPNTPHFPVVYYGALRTGATVVPLSPLLTAGELEYIFRDCTPTALVAWSGFHEAAAKAAEVCGVRLVYSAGPAGGPDTGLPDLLESAAVATGDDKLACTDASDLAVIIYTSGTTGSPKGAALTHDNLMCNSRLFGEKVGLRNSDVALATLPFFHSFGQTCILNAGVNSGVELVLQPRFDAAGALDLIERHRITLFMGVPSMHAAVLAEQRANPRDVSSLRWLASGGSGLAAGLREELVSEFEVPLFEGYGLSETSPITHVCGPGAHKPGKVGQPLWGIEQRIVGDDGALLGVDAVGELHVRGHAVMPGYFNRPDATEAVIDPDGWFATGDMATIDADGFVQIVDRKKDLIIRNGHNVYPSDIETVISAHPAVQLSAVIGIPDDRVGEEVAAVVMLKPGVEATAEEISSFVKERVAADKYPRIVRIVGDLPLGPTGKVLKRAIDLSVLD